MLDDHYVETALVLNKRHCPLEVVYRGTEIQVDGDKGHPVVVVNNSCFIGGYETGTELVLMALYPQGSLSEASAFAEKVTKHAFHI